jgi:hypothetical protein
MGCGILGWEKGLGNMARMEGGMGMEFVFWVDGFLAS